MALSYVVVACAFVGAA